MGEQFFLARLRQLFHPYYDGPEDLHPLQRRALQGTADYGDFVGVPWLHEAKFTSKPLFQQWARKCTAKAGRNWTLLWKGDGRTADGQPLVLMPLEKYEELVNGEPF